MGLLGLRATLRDKLLCQYVLQAPARFVELSVTAAFSLKYLELFDSMFATGSVASRLYGTFQLYDCQQGLSTSSCDSLVSAYSGKSTLPESKGQQPRTTIRVSICIQSPFTCAVTFGRPYVLQECSA